MQKRKPAQELLVQSILLYLKSEKKKLAEEFQQKVKGLENQIVAVRQLVEQAPAPVIQDGGSSKEDLMKTVANYIDLREDKLPRVDYEGMTQEIDKLQKSTKSSTDNVSDLAKQVSALKQAVQRLTFSSGGGGGIEEAYDKAMGVKKMNAQVTNGNVVIDAVYGNTFYLVLNQNVGTLTFKNWTPGTISQRLVLYLQQDATGSRTITSWDPAVKWNGGEVPTLSETAAAIDCIVFETFDNGATVFGNIVGQGYS
jgi:archaellum component FlaC